MATMDLGARGGSGYVRLPVEERVVECTIDGDRVRPSWLASAGERVVRCRDCAYCEKGRDGWHVCNRWNEPLIFADGDGFCAWGVAKEVDER